MALLEVSNLGIAFGGLQAVAQLDLSIEKGHLYGLIGPNGAGKTTVFNMLTGVYKPTEGNIILDGKDITGTQDLSAEIGYGRRIGRNLALSLTARYARSDQGFGEKPMQGVSFDVGAAYRGTLRAVEGARWIVGLRLADIGPDVKASDGERCGLPIRGSLGGSLHLPFRSNHMLCVALDLSHQFRGGITGLAAGAEYTFFRHGVVRGGYHFGHKNKGTGNYASLGCGFIAGPVRCDAAWRLGGDRFNPLNDTFLFSVGFLL